MLKYKLQKVCLVRCQSMNPVILVELCSCSHQQPDRLTEREYKKDLKQIVSLCLVDQRLCLSHLKGLCDVELKARDSGELRPRKSEQS